MPPVARDLRLSTEGTDPATLDAETAERYEVIEMMGYYGYGMSAWMWIIGTLMMFAFWGGLAALVVYTVRAFVQPRGGQESADEILKRRLAAGQISQEEYERTSRALHG